MKTLSLPNEDLDYSVRLLHSQWVTMAPISRRKVHVSLIQWKEDKMANLSPNHLKCFQDPVEREWPSLHIFKFPRVSCKKIPTNKHSKLIFNTKGKCTPAPSFTKFNSNLLQEVRHCNFFILLRDKAAYRYKEENPESKRKVLRDEGGKVIT